MKENDTQDLLDFASKLRWEVGENFHDNLVEGIYTDASQIAQKTEIRQGAPNPYNFERKLDQVLTSNKYGFPIMILILSIILWLTIQGANYPSGLLASFFLEFLHPLLKLGASQIGLPWWLDGFLVDGVYLAMGWVISVMLPPMAIFFPMFTLLEDFGYLPRVAFNLDSLFKKSGAHGKQALTMSMGWGCNAAGVVATRIIDSPRERLIAIITNNFSLCNGRWPTQILIATIFYWHLSTCWFFIDFSKYYSHWCGSSRCRIYLFILMDIVKNLIERGSIYFCLRVTSLSSSKRLDYPLYIFH